MDRDNKASVNIKEMPDNRLIPLPGPFLGASRGLEMVKCQISYGKFFMNPSILRTSGHIEYDI